MDETAVAGMIFSLLVTAMIGGFILLFPLSRRLGDYLQYRMRKSEAVGPPELRELQETVRSLQQRLRTLEERQEFLESLAAGAERPALPESRQRAE